MTLKKLDCIRYLDLIVPTRSACLIKHMERIQHKVCISHMTCNGRILDHLGSQYRISTSYMACNLHMFYDIPCRNIWHNLSIFCQICSCSSRIQYTLGSRNWFQKDLQCMAYRTSISPISCNRRILYNCLGQ